MDFEVKICSHSKLFDLRPDFSIIFSTLRCWSASTASSHSLTKPTQLLFQKISISMLPEPFKAEVSGDLRFDWSRYIVFIL